MRRSSGTAITRLFKANPPVIALGMIAARLWRKIVSALLGLQLKAPGLYLGPGCRVIGGRSITFGRGVYANRNLWLEAVTSYQSQFFNPVITIGDHVCFSDSVHISSIQRIEIAEHVLFGSKVFVSDHNHGSYSGESQSRPEEPPADRTLCGGGPVTIGANVWIGDNAVILGPASIGSGAIIGANSLVRGEVPPNCVVAGAPAKVIKRFNSETGTWDKA
jgi:lipopolysaccharide O-acetyltransferase